MTVTPKKLIEVALPLDAINAASAREKSIRHGHPSTLHLWWARRPLAAARAVLFAQLVDDPSAWPDLFPTEEAQEAERQRLFRIIEELVQWENTTNEAVLQQARDEIWRSWRRTCEANKAHPRAAELFDPERLPAFHDPFAGGGAIPLEAQRLGLESYASDLNPVAVLINKAMIEIPPRFAGRPPVNPKARRDLFTAEDAKERRGEEDGSGKNKTIPPRPSASSAVNTGSPRPSASSAVNLWPGAKGLAEDVRYYGQWMRDEAEWRIGHLYPKVQVVREADGSYRHATAEEIEAWSEKQEAGSEKRGAGSREQEAASSAVASRSSLPASKVEELTVIAWLWARTVKSPNPAFAHVDVPLASTFLLSTKPGKQAYIEPVIEGDGYRFTVKVGNPPESAKNGTKLARGANFQCLMSGMPISPAYIYSEGNAGRMGARLMAIVAEGDRGRAYLAADDGHQEIARKAQPDWRPDVPMPDNPRWFSPPLYGLKTFGELFTPRQLVALSTFADLVQDAREQVQRDALAAGQLDDDKHLRDGGVGATAYAEAVGVYLASNVSKFSDLNNNLVTWKLDRGCPVHLFARQAIPMVWDYPEANPFSESSGSWDSVLWHLMTSTTDVCLPAIGYGHKAVQMDARTSSLSLDRLVSTDPPYYDNIGYADLSDFFYVWLRRSLRSVFPDLFATLAVPKTEELVATPYRHASKEKAETFFLDGMTQAMRCLAEQAHSAFPVTIYYAFKQSESERDGATASTGWETFLEAVSRAGFALTGTWPIRTEMRARQVAMGTNALASSIVLVCRPRTATAPIATRGEFVRALKAELPLALAHLQRGNIAPVDLAQAAIGPGMAVYTRYGQVLDAQGKPLTVRDALALINQTLDEVLAEQEGDFDADSRWALAWFEQHGFTEGDYGVAETLSKAKNTSVGGLVQAGIALSKGGKVRLLRPAELHAAWDPATDSRLTVWEMVHHLIRVLEGGGEAAAADLLARLGSRADVARELAYRLYSVSERKKRAADALSYNALVQSWPEIARLARETSAGELRQGGLFGEA